MSIGGWPGILVCNQCPRCNSPLRGVAGAHFDARKCPSCKGIWVDNAGSRALATNGDAEIERAAAANTGFARPHHARALGPCPICGGPLATVTAVGGRVTLDLCAAHGTWFDATEVAVVVEAVTGRKPTAPRMPTDAELAMAAKSGEHADFVGIRGPDRRMEAALSGFGERRPAFESVSEITDDSILGMLVGEILDAFDE